MAVRDFGNPPVLDASAVLTDPSSGDVIADTDELLSGNYELRVIIGGSAAGTWYVQHRNAANGANVGDVVALFTAAGQSSEVVLTYHVHIGERLRVVAATTLTGSYAGAVQAEGLI